MINDILKTLADSIINNRSAIMSFASEVGTLSTFIFTIRANDKANERRHEAQAMKGENLTTWDRVKAEATAYILPGTICAATIGTIATNEHLNAVDKGKLMLGIAALSKLYSDRKKAMNDVLEQKDKEKVQTAIAKANAEAIPKRKENHEGKTLYYDEYSEQWFYATPEIILEAEQDINKLYGFNEHVCVNVFYNALRHLGVTEVKPQPGFDLIGWAKWHVPKNDICAPRYLEFYHVPVKNDDGEDYVIIEMACEPEAGYYGY